MNFQSHGQFHPVLTMCNDGELETEMIEAKKYFKTTFWYSCNAIAYPCGRHDEKVVGTAKITGYMFCRVANKPGSNTVNTDLFRLKGIGVESDLTPCALGKQIAWAEIRWWLSTYAIGEDK